MFLLGGGLVRAAVCRKQITHPVLLRSTTSLPQSVKRGVKNKLQLTSLSRSDREVDQRSVVG